MTKTKRKYIILILFVEKVMFNEPESTSIIRIKLPKNVSEPVYISFENLEAIKEIYQARKAIASKNK